MIRQRFLQQYTQNEIQTGVEGASPHRLVQMLYEGLIDRLMQAKGAIARKNFEAKSRNLNKAVEIISHLQSTLDMDKGGDFSENLFQLYDFFRRQLFLASRNNDLLMLDDVVSLVKELKTAWDEMPAEYRRMSSEELKNFKVI